VLRGGAALAVYGSAYFPAASVLGVNEAGAMLKRFWKLLGGPEGRGTSGV